jgi:signal transduction histidine kinase/ActR/RegA family two-component response regulator
MFEDLYLNHPSKDQSSDQSLPTGYWSYDIKSKTWTLSPEIDALWELDTSEQRTKKSLFDAILSEDRPIVQQLWHIALQENQAFTCRYRMKIHDHIRWFFVNSRIDFHQQEAVAYYGTISDITKTILHELEDQSTLRALEQEIIKLRHDMEENKTLNLEISKAKSSFFSAMSHEIRTPMNAMIGFTSLLELTTLSDEQREYVLRMKDASSHLLSIINDILDLSKMEAGKLTIEKAPFRLQQLIDDVRSIMEDQAKRKHLYLDFETMNCPQVIIADRFRLRQILINLIHNAIKFTETGGVSVVFRVNHTPENITLDIHVKDTGIGMTDLQQLKLFGDYMQASSSISRLYGGTGLGLSISQKLTHLMDGSIRVSSKLNEGSTFTLSLPIEKDEVDELEEHDVLTASPRRGALILMAEDHLLSQKLSERLLTHLGMKMVLVDNGLLAVQKVKDQAFDIIFLDLHMPVMDGIQAAQTIRRFNTKTPIIGLTANAFFEERSQCFLAGMNDLLIKPFDQETLKNMLAKWIPEE